MTTIYCDVEGGNISKEDCVNCCLLKRQDLKSEEYEKCTFYGKATPREELRQVMEDDY